jgi:hypothetical protein
MIVIVAAIFMYNFAQSTGALTTIKNMLSGITTDKRIQVLILVWGFGSFLEAVAGYGTAVAIPASILIVLGFQAHFCRGHLSDRQYGFYRPWCSRHRHHNFGQAHRVRSPWTSL